MYMYIYISLLLSMYSFFQHGFVFLTLDSEKHEIPF